ncbi:hypothetical protein Syun_002984 [Stephania yunnanensis]|uniref:YTH domain-containing family protein n=1 Tax=Stephania yunnanensis TaxID=152371 RepID=A0AAP0PZF4_9MAGN
MSIVMGGEDGQVKEPSDAKSLNLTENENTKKERKTCNLTWSSASQAAALESNTSDTISTISSLADSISATKIDSDQQSPDGCRSCSNTEATPLCLNSSSLDGERPEDAASLVAGPKPGGLAADSVDLLELKDLDFVNSGAVGDPPSITLSKVPLLDSDHQSVTVKKSCFVMRKFSTKSSADVDLCSRAQRDNTSMSNRPSNRNRDGNDHYQFKRHGNIAGLKEPHIDPKDSSDRFQFSRVGNAAGFKEPNHGPRDDHGRFHLNKDSNAACLKQPNHGPVGCDLFQFNIFGNGGGSRGVNHGPREGCERFPFNRVGNGAGPKEANHGPRDEHVHFHLNRDCNAACLKEPNQGPGVGCNQFQFNRFGNGAGSRGPNHGPGEGRERFHFDRVGNDASSREASHGPRDGYRRLQFSGDGNAADLVEQNHGPRDSYNQFQFNRDGNFGRLKEPNRGPRARRESNPLSLSCRKEQLGFMIKRDSYNREDFPTIYDNAKFFVIKSYSEDDVQKSIKYNVWSSTPNGNKKLDAAFHDARTISNGVAAACPLFLFFSVNGSGQFLGVAEMIGRVDFKKDMDFWRGNSNKWNGFFPVKWHIIKDVSNSNLRHIILENNDNRPVTFTRDTQEIEYKQGIKMLTIFKNYHAKTSMLDDFKYYDEKEKTLHEERYHAASTELDAFIMEFPNLVHMIPQHSGADLSRAKDASSWSEGSFSSETFSHSAF